MRILIALLAVAPIAAQSQVNLLDPAVIEHGAGLFAQGCAVGYCHGSAGRAARGPELRHRRWSPQALYRITHDGIDGTSMPAWKNVINEPDIWAIAGYILSLSGQPPDGPTTVQIGTADAAKPELSAQAKRGEELFFDLNREKRCSLCHRVGDWGRAIGPSLEQAAPGKAAEELTTAIKEPQSSLAFGFQQATVKTASGETVTGVLRGQDDDVVRIYDTSVLPPPLRTFQANQVGAGREVEGSAMPSATELGYSANEVKSLVAYLREL